MNLISTLPIPFLTIAIDFIVVLLYFNGKNMLLTVIYKFIKKKLLILRFDKWTASN